MKKFIILTLILFQSSVLYADSDNSFYQITYSTEINDDFLIICFFDECKRTSSSTEKEGTYIYDFGIFPISLKNELDLKVWLFNKCKKRIKRAPEYIPESCTINDCGNFTFTKTNGPATSKTGRCEIGLAMCHRVRSR